MHKKCPDCQLVNYPEADNCIRCSADLKRIVSSVSTGSARRSGIFMRAVVCFLVCLAVVTGFYFSLVYSARPLSVDQKYQVRQSIKLIREKGFSTEAFLLENLTVYRADDNWLNASVAKENAFAATNFPFEIMTLYSDFFTYPEDVVERAAILLHESKHLQGADEPEAYEFVWRNRKVLGWTKDEYLHSPVWANIRHQTREVVPHLFTCPENDMGDCTE